MEEPLPMHLRHCIPTNRQNQPVAVLPSTASHARGRDAEKIRSLLSIPGKTGPNRPLFARPVAAVRLHQTSHSCIAQRFVGLIVGVPTKRTSNGPLAHGCKIRNDRKVITQTAV